MMRLRRIEFTAIAITFAFICFMGGYFAGSRGSVNIAAIEPRNSAAPQVSVVETSGGGAASSAAPGTGPSAASDAVNDYAIPVISVEDTGAVTAPEYSTAPAAGAVDEAPGAPRGGDGRININFAPRSELMDLPGIGTVLAGRIIDYRNQYGAFSSIDDIRKVSGIGEKRFEAIRNMITVN